MARITDRRIDFMQAHPRLFDLLPENPERSFGYPNCKEGWREILERLCTRIENALTERETFEFVRIKQKFGVLRVDWDRQVSDDTRAKIAAAIDLAVARSACSCETCGAEGRLYLERACPATACTEHAVGDRVPDKFGIENLRILGRMFGAREVYYALYDRGADTLTEVSPRSLGLED
jgi:hypothetical protein